MSKPIVTLAITTYKLTHNSKELTGLFKSSDSTDQYELFIQLERLHMDNIKKLQGNIKAMLEENAMLKNQITTFGIADTQKDVEITQLKNKIKEIEQTLATEGTQKDEKITQLLSDMDTMEQTLAEINSCFPTAVTE